MVLVIYVCPNFTANAVKFIDVLSGIAGVRFALVSQEPTVLLPPDIQTRIAGFRQVPDVFDADSITFAATELHGELGAPVHRLIGAVEALQVPLVTCDAKLASRGHSAEIHLVPRTN